MVMIRGIAKLHNHMHVLLAAGEFSADGRMAERHASINDVPIKASELRIARQPAASSNK